MMKPSLQLRLGQQLTMTPQLQQAIRLLQLTALDLQATIREALESNVMLEAEEEPEGISLGELGVATEPAGAAQDDTVAPPGDEPVVEIGDDYYEPTAAAADSPWSGSGGGDERDQEFADESGRTLHDHLNWQLELAHLSPRELAIGRALVDAINDDGYLVEDPPEAAASLRPDIDATPAELDLLLHVVQHLDPAGVGARNLAECVALQLEQLDPATPGRALALAIARDHLGSVAEQQYPALRRALQCTQDELEQALVLVRSCHPRPGSIIEGTRTEYVVPDVFIRRGERGWVVELNVSALPRIRLNDGYAGLITRAAEHATMRTQLQEARWLLRSLEIRNETLLRVARCIVSRQAAFFEQGDEAMQPMVLKDVATEVEMHESTISRVTTGKYMHTPRGVFEFRHFFSSHVGGDDGTEVSSTAIRAKIRKLVAAEDAASPLSDSRIAEMLSQDGVQVARRTVAKYREALGIAPSSERRRLGAR
jgi:RNA polymerase sigma-54 factor